MDPWEIDNVESFCAVGDSAREVVKKLKDEIPKDASSVMISVRWSGADLDGSPYEGHMSVNI